MKASMVTVARQTLLFLLSVLLLAVPYASAASTTSSSMDCVSTNPQRICEVSQYAGSISGFVDSVPRLAAAFNQPADVVAAPFLDALLIADAGNNVIRSLSTATGLVSTLCGNGNDGLQNGDMESAEFSAPSSLAVDPVAGVVYVADTGNNVIRAINITAGQVHTLVGSGDSASLNGNGLNASFASPSHVAFRAGVLFVAEQGGSSLRMVNLTTAEVTTLCGSESSPGMEDGSCSSARFQSIADFTLGATPEGDVLIVADGGNGRIVSIDLNSVTATTIAAVDGVSALEFSSSSGQLYLASSSQSKLFVMNFPNGTPYQIAGSIHGTPGNTNGECTQATFGNQVSCLTSGGMTGSLILCDADNHQLRMISTNEVMPSCMTNTLSVSASLRAPSDVVLTPDNTKLIFIEPETGSIRAVSIATGTVTAVTSDGQIAQPSGVAIDSTGNVLFVSDSIAGTISAVDPNVGNITIVATGLSQPSALTFVRQSEEHGFELAVVVGNNRVILLSTASATASLICGMDISTGHADGACTDAKFMSIFDVAFQHPYIYLTDSPSNVVRRINIEQEYVETIAGVPGAGPALVDGIGADAMFSSPAALTFSRSGNHLYISEHSGGAIRALEIATGRVATIAGGLAAGTTDGDCSYATFQSVVGLAAIPTGNSDFPDELYAVDNTSSAIRHIRWDQWAFARPLPPASVNYPSCSVTTYSGSLAGGRDGYRTAATHMAPGGIVTSAGRTFALFVDTELHALRKIDFSTDHITTLVGGQGSGFADGNATIARFNQPVALALSLDETVVYVVDKSNHRVRMVNLTDGSTTTIAGSGTPWSVDGTGTSAAFNTPRGIAIAHDGTDGEILFVIDGSNTVRRIVTSSGAVSTFCGSGTTGFRDGSCATARFNGVTAITAGNGFLYLTESGNVFLRAIDIAAGDVSTIGGGGSDGWADGYSFDALFDGPVSVAGFHDANHLLVGESNGRLRLVRLSDSFIITIAGSGEVGLSEGDCRTVQLGAISGIAPGATKDEWLLVDASTHTVRMLTVNEASVECVADIASGSNPGHYDATLEWSLYQGPAGLSVDPVSNTVYVTERDGHRIRAMHPISDVVETVAGSGVSGSADGAASSATFSAPSLVTHSNSDAALFVLDSGTNAIRRVGLVDGQVSTVTSNITELGTVRALVATGATFASGDPTILVADSRPAILRIDVLTGSVTPVCGQQASPGLTDGHCSVAQFQENLLFSSFSDMLVVLEGYDHQLRKVELTTGAVTSWMFEGAPVAGATGVVFSPSGGHLIAALAGGREVVAIDMIQATSFLLAGSTDTPATRLGLCSFALFNGIAGLGAVPGATASDPVELFVSEPLEHRIRRVTTVALIEPTPVPTPSFCPSPSATPSPTPSSSPSATASATPTASQTPSQTPSQSSTPSQTPSHTVTPSVTPSVTDTPSQTPSHTASPSVTPSVTDTPSQTPSHTASATQTSSQTPSSSATSSQTSSSTRTSSMTSSNTPTSSRTPTTTPTASATSTRTATHSSTATGTPSMTGSSSQTASPSASVSPTPSASVTPSQGSSRSPTRTRSMSATASVTPSVTSSGSVTPSSTASPSAPPTPYIWVGSAWSTCSKSCGGGVRTRAVFCATRSGEKVTESLCRGAPPASSQACNEDDCPALSWEPTGRPGPCSSLCMDGTEESLGFALIPGHRCVSNGTAVNSTVCEAAGLSVPSSSVPCNRFPCPSTTVYWRSGMWGECSSLGPNECGPGQQSRLVECVGVSGAVVPASNCEAVPLLERPTEIRQCSTGVPCNCTLDNDCRVAFGADPVPATVIISPLDGSMVFVADGPKVLCVAEQCGCNPSWTGLTCEIPRLVPSEGLPSDCAEGLIDAAGSCCVGAIDATSGLCCAPGATTDKDGHCCSEEVDACGVCGGSGIAVDINGMCCDSALTDAGLCCTAGLDSCGVCGGESACEAAVTLPLAGFGPDASAAQIAIADALGVDASVVQSVVVASPSGPTSFSLLSTARLSDAEIVSALLSSPGGAGISEHDMVVVRSTECGNSICETAEGCSDETCTDGCRSDCPLPTLACPTSSELVCSGHGHCATSSGECQCFFGYTGASCDNCEGNFLESASGMCVFQAGNLASCNDGVENGNEEGVDCGGPHCRPCFSDTSSSNLPVGYIAAGVAVVAVGGLAYTFFSSSSKGKKPKNKVAPIPAQSTEQQASHHSVSSDPSGVVPSAPAAVPPAGASSGNSSQKPEFW